VVRKLHRLHPFSRYILLVIALGASSSSLFSQKQTPASPAAMFRNGLDHSGVYPDAGTGVYGGVMWRKQTDAAVRSSPTIVGGLVLIGSSDGHFYALDADTGHEKWKFSADSAIASSAAVVSGRVFFSSYKGTFYAVTFADGKLLWKTQFGPDVPRAYEREPGPHSPTFNGDFLLSSAAVLNDTVIVGGGDGLVYAFNAKTGTPRWKFRTEGRIRSSPAISNGAVYVGSYDGSLYAIDFNSGKLIWRYDTKGRSVNPARFDFDRQAILSSPAVVDGVVYIGSRDSHLYAVDAAKGTLRWIVDYEKDGFTWAISSPAVHDDVVYMGTADGHFVHALRATDGQEIWRFKMPDRLWSSPVVAGPELYVTNQSGSLYVIDLKSGKESWQFQTRSSIQSSPAVANGVVYFGGDDGGVYAIRAEGAQSMQRAVYYDPKMAKLWASFGAKGESAFRDFFVARGFALVDAATLGDWLAKRIADRAPSVVVFATSVLPDAVRGSDPSHGPFRQYLDSGGKVVWSGINPPMLFELIFNSDSQITGAALRWDDAGKLLGISYKGGLQNNSASNRVTPAGLDCGLPEWWLGTWDVPISNEMTVLSLDDRGFAGAWVKNYGGAPGTGFVYIGLQERRDDMLSSLAMVAEYRPR
jgi:eukaryotic-like serine/threonine-protein kinase